MADINPPNVANANANASLTDAYAGGHAANAAIRIGRASKRRKTAETLYANGSITEAEMGQEDVFHLQQTSSALPPGAVAAANDAPPWFGPAMAQALAPVNAQMANINAQLANINARQMNSTALSLDDVLHPIQDAAGAVPANFPASLRAFGNLTPLQMRNMLQFYGLPGNPAPTRESRLKQFMGIRP